MQETNHSHPHIHDETKIVSTTKGQLALSIFEEGVPPRFRIHLTDDVGQQLGPNPDDAYAVRTIRSDGSRQDFSFALQEGGYLEASSNLPEPHQFEATLTIVGMGTPSHFDFVFVEHAEHGHDDPTGLKGLALSALHMGHSHGQGDHSHVSASGTLLSSQRGIWALKWSFVGLGLTALLQAWVVTLSSSTGLLADTIHNFADAGTAIPLWIAFRLQQRSASERFTYGLHRTEDLAGLAIVLIILASALAAGYASIDRLMTQQMPSQIPLAMMAAFVGFVGNELVAQFRLKVGREIESAALVADGLHARTDGFTSLAALAGLAGAQAGFPILDGIAGLLITALILKIVLVDAVPSVFARLLDGIEPATVERLLLAAARVNGVEEVNWIRARWSGHRINVEANVRVDPGLTMDRAHEVAHEVEHQMGHAIEHPGHLIVVASIHRERLTEGHIHTHEHLVAD